MVYKVKKKASKEDIKALKQKIWPGVDFSDGEGFNAHKYCGVLKMGGVSPKIPNHQSDMRNVAPK